MIRTEKDHLDMMRHADRWPAWPFLPLKHRSRPCSLNTPLRETGFMFEANDDSGEAAPKVYIGVMGITKPSEARFEMYDSLEAVVAAGWEVD